MAAGDNGTLMISHAVLKMAREAQRKLALGDMRQSDAERVGRKL